MLPYRWDHRPLIAGNDPMQTDASVPQKSLEPSRSDPAERLPWSPPVIEDLPPLSELTLQSSIIGGPSVFGSS